jgi:hypothetical protein
MVAAKLEGMKHGGKRATEQDANLHLATTRTEAASMLSVSPRSVAAAKFVQGTAEEPIRRAPATE